MLAFKIKAIFMVKVTFNDLGDRSRVGFFHWLHFLILVRLFPTIVRFSISKLRCTFYFCWPTFLSIMSLLFQGRALSFFRSLRNFLARLASTFYDQNQNQPQNQTTTPPLLQKSRKKFHLHSHSYLLITL